MLILALAVHVLKDVSPDVQTRYLPCVCDAAPALAQCCRRCFHCLFCFAKTFAPKQKRAALAHLAKDTWIAMRHAYQPRPGAGYTASDYATAVKAILESPYSAVDSNLLQVALGGAQPLEAMVAAGQLAMRPFSPWAHDIDAAAFGERGLAVVVTAPSSMHLHLMTLHRDELLAPLLQKQQSTQVRCVGSKGVDLRAGGVCLAVQPHRLRLPALSLTTANSAPCTQHTIRRRAPVAQAAALTLATAARHRTTQPAHPLTHSWRLWQQTWQRSRPALQR